MEKSSFGESEEAFGFGHDARGKLSIFDNNKSSLPL
jgi:hypothetical protein